MSEPFRVRLFATIIDVDGDGGVHESRPRLVANLSREEFARAMESVGLERQTSPLAWGEAYTERRE